MPDDSGGAGVVHIVAPFGRDAESIAAVLHSAGLATAIAPTLAALADALDARAGAVLVTEEAVASGTDALVEALAQQPAWSTCRSSCCARRARTAGRRPMACCRARST